MVLRAEQAASQLSIATEGEDDVKATFKRQTGTILLLAIFTMMILSALALAMLFSADTETSISMNYRDKQAAGYAAAAGLEEARTRIQPTSGDLAKDGLVPTDLPSSGSANVLYILNPAPGETVAPWDPSPNNPYRDTEICQENIPGLCSGGLPPAGAGWYKTANALSSSKAVPYKWTRVTLKSASMIPLKMATGAPAIGDGSSTQACWTGSRQQMATTVCNTSAGSGSSASGGGKVATITITNPGSGYTAPPTITITPIALTGGSGATATAEIQPVPGGGITGVQLGNGGSGYKTPPLVEIQPVDGNGSGAEVTAQIGGSPVLSVSVDNPTSSTPCYASGASLTPSFDPTVGSGAAGTVVMHPNPSCVYSFTVKSNGCTPGAAYDVTGSGGFSATVQMDSTGNVGTAIVKNPGTSDLKKNNLNVAGCNQLNVDSVTNGVRISKINVDAGGSYAAAPTVTVSGATPAGSSALSFTSTLVNPDTPGQVTGLKIVSAGSGFTAPPTLKFTVTGGGGGSGADATASIGSTNVVSKITITNPGGGYVMDPVVQISDPGGSGTTAKAVATITVDGGSVVTGNGSNVPMGNVYLLTAMAATPGGTKAMRQVEVASSWKENSFSFAFGGALTLAGPNPQFGTPDSNNLVMNGKDLNSCNETPSPKPSIGVYEDPTKPPPPEGQPPDPTSIDIVTQALGKPDNYIGQHGSPDIEDIKTLGDPKSGAAGLKAFADTVCAEAKKEGNLYTTNNPTINLGSEKSPQVNCVQGDYLMGPVTGYGILLVTGTLTFHGNYDWHGPILVIGEGASIMRGGGNGVVQGAVYVSNLGNGTLSSPDAAWAGGGGNSVLYDHCWADKLIADRIKFMPPPLAQPLTLISVRNVN
jgi:hypothetical protein